MLFCRNKAQFGALLKEFSASLEDVPGTDCLRSRRTTFQFCSNRARDNYRTYEISAVETALLLQHRVIPNPGNGAWDQLCTTDGCVNVDHYCKRTQSHVRASRIDRATSPDNLFPPLWSKTITPSGHARSGSRNHNTAISDEVAAQVLHLRYTLGLTYRSIAERMHLKQAAIYSICSGNSKRRLAQSLRADLIAGARRNGILPPDPAPEATACADAP